MVWIGWLQENFCNSVSFIINRELEIFLKNGGWQEIGGEKIGGGGGCDPQWNYGLIIFSPNCGWNKLSFVFVNLDIQTLLESVIMEIIT